MKNKDEIKETLKEKKEKVQKKVNEVKDEVFKFIGEHPMLIFPFLSGCGAVLTGAYHMANRHAEKEEEKCLVEDDITGLDFKTKRPMTNSEILELGERMIDGQTKGDALNDMGLLKKERRR